MAKDSMTNVFLKINKDLFNQGLNPLEILIVAQIAEFQGNTSKCFISDETIAKQFGTSVATVSRAIKKLEEKGWISRETKNIRGGKVRHLSITNNHNEQNEVCKIAKNNNDNSTISKMLIDNEQNEVCTMSKLLIVNEQNDIIKDNIKDKIEKEESSPSENPLSVDRAASLAPSPSASIAEYKKVKEFHF